MGTKAEKAPIDLVSDDAYDRRRGESYKVKTITAGTGRALLAAAPTAGTSKVNKGIPKWMAVEILTKGIAAHPDEKPISTLVARNILREVGRTDVAKQVG